jgi:hypothetical protein
METSRISEGKAFKFITSIKLFSLEEAIAYAEKSTDGVKSNFLKRTDLKIEEVLNFAEKFDKYPEENPNKYKSKVWETAFSICETQEIGFTLVNNLKSPNKVFEVYLKRPKVIEFMKAMSAEELLTLGRKYNNTHLWDAILEMEKVALFLEEK